MNAIQEINKMVKSAEIYKTADGFKQWASWVIEGINKNKLTRGEILRSAAIGSIATALAGAGIGALTGKGGKRKKRAIWGAMIGALAGGAAGPAYAKIRKYLDGVPFDNSAFEKATHKKGDRVYIGVAGSANGENDSWFGRDMRYQFGPANVVMLRHVDGKKLRETYDSLKRKGLDVNVVGHSSGAATVAKFLNDRPDAKGYMIDPVSWIGRSVPKNGIVFTSDKSTRHGGSLENYIADAGGRWNFVGDNSMTFKGSHSDRNADILRDIVARNVMPGEDQLYIPRYITNVFGKDIKEN
jgi:hypothetical protein